MKSVQKSSLQIAPYVREISGVVIGLIQDFYSNYNDAGERCTKEFIADCSRYTRGKNVKKKNASGVWEKIAQIFGLLAMLRRLFVYLFPRE